MQKFILFLCSLALLGCDNRSVVEDDISKIPVVVSVIRFDKAFASATVKELPSLKEKFPMFFSTRIPDSVWVQRMQDPLQQEMAAEILKIFPDETLLAEKLGPLFQHIKYYFPRFKVPTTVTLINDVDYKNRVLVASDTLLILSLDNYLGADHRYYSETKKYIVKNLKAAQLERDIAEAYAQLYVSTPSKNTFLEHIIYFGKQLYLQDVWLPNVSDASKMGYTEPEWQWVQDNELDMWRYFVEKELLFSTDPGLTPRFISNAPFSKFYLELDNESPGMAGRYLGWQIVRSFVENNTITPQQLLVFDAEALFKKSNYKPKK
ncbi:MAG: gliding motility-associated lipoprotein GldB [Patiriisocius sp.]|jgi:gliding motility-associated lipoprotein GldB